MSEGETLPDDVLEAALDAADAVAMTSKYEATMRAACQYVWSAALAASATNVARAETFADTMRDDVIKAGRELEDVRAQLARETQLRREAEAALARRAEAAPMSDDDAKRLALLRELLPFERDEDDERFLLRLLDAETARAELWRAGHAEKHNEAAALRAELAAAVKRADESVRVMAETDDRLLNAMRECDRLRAERDNACDANDRCSAELDKARAERDRFALEFATSERNFSRLAARLAEAERLLDECETALSDLTCEMDERPTIMRKLRAFLAPQPAPEARRPVCAWCNAPWCDLDMPPNGAPPAQPAAPVQGERLHLDHDYSDLLREQAIELAIQHGYIAGRADEKQSRIDPPAEPAPTGVGLTAAQLRDLADVLSPWLDNDGAIDALRAEADRRDKGGE